tara:strand:- start:5229 stop:5480 length:252 start_codon:yes stop_codon:yes gene_type:complete
MGFNDNFYKKKAAALGVNIDKDTVVYGSNINELKMNVKSALKQPPTAEYDFSKYPIRNSMFQLKNNSGEQILSSDYWTTISKD